jgi:hypothetical protein
VHRARAFESTTSYPSKTFITPKVVYSYFSWKSIPQIKSKSKSKLKAAEQAGACLLKDAT